jgi:hypothetical protein
MWRPLWFLSLWAALAASPAHARWTVELRPLDTRPYTRDFEPLFRMHAKSGLSHLEGLGVELARGETVLFEVPLLKEERPRQLELHVGYLTPDQAPRAQAQCLVSFRVDTGDVRQVDLTLPLRSIEPRSIPMAGLRARYDYLTPQVTAGLPAGATRLKVTARVEGECTAGKLVVMDPKVWRRESAEPPKRLIFIPADSISGDWFDQDRHFMPFVEQYFSRPGARFNTNVISVGTNTHDAVNIFSKMAFELRGGTYVSGVPRGPGLVPAFLEAGYEVVSFNSNLLMSTLWQPSGFRSFFNLNTRETPLNEAHAEVLGDMMIDWLKRHPDHDVFLYGWIASTHYHGAAPRTRPGLRLDKVLDPARAPAYARKPMLLQAHTMSYVDLALEKFLQEPLVEAADVLFFSDHGLNFVTLDHGLPMWGRCEPKVAPSNWQMAPEELRVPVGIRVHGYDPGPIPFETSLLDWVYSALKHHNPKLPLDTFVGRELSLARPDDALVAVSHGRRGAIRVSGRQFYFEDSCEGHDTVFFLDSDRQPASPDLEVGLANMLAARDLLRVPYGQMTVELFHGGPDCPVSLKLPPAVLQDGSQAPATLQVDPTRWYTRLELYLPRLPGAARTGLSIESSRPGCAEIQAGYARLKLPEQFQLQGSGLEPLLHLTGPDVTPGTATVIRPHVLPGQYAREGKNFVTRGAVAPTRAAPLSKELRAAMKRWGYIQDDEPEH